MRLYICFSVLITLFLAVKCSHTFMGTNVLKQLVYHRDTRYSSYFLRKRVENINYAIPDSFGFGRTIQGILAYDLTNSEASANVTAGGIGYPFVTLRMKSARGEKIHYDIFIYA